MSNGIETDAELEASQSSANPRPRDKTDISQKPPGAYGIRGLDTNMFRVDESSIEDKQGNFVITVGNVGSGKSTLQHHLVLRLNDHPNIALEWNNHSNDSKHDFLLERWLEHFKQTQILPTRTRVGLIQEFNLKVTQRKKKPLEFNFLEISGEDIRMIRPEYIDGLSSSDETDDEYEEITKAGLPDNINSYLKNNDCKKRFIFVSDCNANHKHKRYRPNGQPREDSLFLALLQHLLDNDEIHLRRLEVLFVAAKWDLVREAYNNDVKNYFEANFENTMSYLREKSSAKNIDYRFTPYSIGDVEIINTQEDDRQMAKVKDRVETCYIDVITHWIIQSFSGEKWEGLPPITLSLWERVKRLFA